MHPKDIQIKDFTYDLPKERIAEKPLQQRDSSKLLVWEKYTITEDLYKNIAAHLEKDSLIVFNDTKVIPARILFQKDTGGIIEIFCLEPYGEHKEHAVALNSHGKVEWKCMIGGASKWKEGSLKKKIIVNNEKVILSVSLSEKLTDAYVAAFSWLPAHFTFAEILQNAGEMPLPPYIKRKVEASDKERYQTIFAKEEGSVAAPTAALHFSEEILKSLSQKNILQNFVTLHVGAGTFKPVKASAMEHHEMHSEWIDVSKDVIENLIKYAEKNIIAVGTTSARTLESLYWMGVKTHTNPDIFSQEISISQWEVYEQPISNTKLDKSKALNALLVWMEKNKLTKLMTSTQILITPGYKFRVINNLVTNFHQPQSTLLLLIAAATGNDWRKIYNYALENDFRFLSYGDGSLLKISAQ